MCVYAHVVHGIETVVGQKKFKEKPGTALHIACNMAYLQPAQNAVATDTFHHRHLSMQHTSTTGGEGGEVRSGRVRSA